MRSLETALTRLDEPWCSLTRCAAPIRAAASRHNSPLTAVGDTDRAAAVIGVEACMVALRLESLDDAVKHGSAATAALARSLARGACGRDEQRMSAAQERELVLQQARPDDLWFADVEMWAAAVRAWGEYPAEVFARAATDLCVGPPTVQAMALLLWDAASTGV